jgi:hypothetical protein
MKKPIFCVLPFQLASIVCLAAAVFAQPPYAASDLLGTWGFGLSGTVIVKPASSAATGDCAGGAAVSRPVAMDGTLVADGKGGLTGVQTLNIAGTVCSGTLKGSYSVNPDGTGTLDGVVFTPAADSPVQCTVSVTNSSFTFSNGVNHLDLTGTDCFQVVSGTATRQ